jgi:hypothetical protein
MSVTSWVSKSQQPARKIACTQNKGMNCASDTEIYERDYYEWIQHNVDLLRRGCVEQADLTHITEEMATNREQREISSCLGVLVHPPSEMETPAGEALVALADQVG